MPPSGGSAISRRMSSRSGTRASLPESTAEEKRVDDALRRHKLVSHEAGHCYDDPVHCFFIAFLDGWTRKDFPTKHFEYLGLRMDAKRCLRDNYKLLLPQRNHRKLVNGIPRHSQQDRGNRLTLTVYRKSQKPIMAKFLQ
jgi:hypothetical protein